MFGVKEGVLHAGDEEMTFTTALQSHLATENLARPPHFTKILGLGGKHFLNLRRDPLQPTLGMEADDYVNFGGEGATVLGSVLVSTSLTCHCVVECAYFNMFELQTHL